MRIAVNVQTLVQNKMEGLGWFTYEIISRIVKNHPEHNFTFIFGKGIVNEYCFSDNIDSVNIGPKYFRPFAWLIKFGFLIPRFVNNGNFDLYISPDGWSSMQIKVKTLIVIHDINFEHYPAFSPWSFRTYYKYFFKRWAKHANRIVTVSQYSKSDIAQTYSVNPQKIDVIYNAASAVYHPIDNEKKQLVRQKICNGASYFLFVGALHPRKNIINLFKAFDKFKVTDTNNVKLVVVGEKFYWDKPTKNVYNNLVYKPDIVFTGRLSQTELKDVMGAALSLTYVSLFEGFGIPIVEAMSCGVPIITSDTTAMPEIAGNAALIVNPRDVNQIAQAMGQIATNEKLRQQLIAEGLLRKLHFSWEISAHNFWKSVENTLL